MVATVLALLCCRAGSLQGPPALGTRIHDEAKRTLQAAQEGLRGQRGRLKLDFEGRELLAPGGSYRKISTAELDAWFQPAFGDVEQSLQELDRQHAAVVRREYDLDKFCGNAYAAVRRAIDFQWQLELREAGSRGDGRIAAMIAELTRMSASHAGRSRNAGTSANAVRAAIEAECRSWFLTAVNQYRAMKNRLKDRRKQLALEYWKWQDLAFRSFQNRDDPHDVAAGQFYDAIVTSFAYQDGHPNSSFSEFVGPNIGQDRLQTSFGAYPWCFSKPFPDVQLASDPGTLQLAGAADEKIDSYRPFEPYARAVWSRNPDVPNANYGIESVPDRAIVPARYSETGKVGLMIGINGLPARDMQAATAAIKVAKVVTATGQMALAEFTRSAAEMRWSRHGTGVAEIPMSELLEKSGGKINQCLLEATADIVPASGGRHAASPNWIFPMRQKVIVFLPGVFGSEITIRHKGLNEERKAFPSSNLGLVGTQPFTWLEADASGFPLPIYEVSKLDLFRKLLVETKATTIYDVESRPELANPKDHLRLLRDGKPEPYYLLYPWPYDWRTRLEANFELLMGVPRMRLATRPNYEYDDDEKRNGDPVLPPYKRPPSLRHILEDARREHPLVDLKVALAGHSTGGVVIRGLLQEPYVETLVDRAFFIDVPFWGAPKAYYVYLTGDMGIPFVAKDFMRKYAPNMPIVYYLAPTARYPGVVATRGAESHRRRPGQSVAFFMKPLILDAQAVDAYPRKGNPAWNSLLEKSASDYHGRIIGQPRIGWDNCRVFWSKSSPKATNGIVTVDMRQRKVIATPTDGDGTVPIVSQQADFGAHPGVLIQLARGPLHVPSPNEPQVWETIAQELCRPNSPYTR